MAFLMQFNPFIHISAYLVIFFTAYKEDNLEVRLFTLHKSTCQYRILNRAVLALLLLASEYWIQMINIPGHANGVKIVLAVKKYRRGLNSALD